MNYNDMVFYYMGGSLFSPLCNFYFRKMTENLSRHFEDDVFGGSFVRLLSVI